MYKFLQPDSVSVRYGTTIATLGRATANIILLGPEPVFATLALSSNITGVAAAHTKAGVTAESGLALCALTALAASAVAKGNPLQLWMAGVGLVAFGNAFANNVRYTKLCPKPWRKYEEKDSVPAPAYAQQKSVDSKPSFFAPLKNLSPVTWLRNGAAALAQSGNDKLKKFGEDAVAITQRKMFAPGVTALIGVTPFIVDGAMKIAAGDPEGWKRAIAGSIIFASNAISMVSIPKKQKHPFNALWREVTGKNKKPDRDDTGLPAPQPLA